ncbi:MAG: helix-turn-helix transcriptional regulator [Hyphomicrobiales bacterium]
MFRHLQIWTAIDRLADINGLSPSGLARKAGLDATAFNKSKRFSKEGRERWPSTESLAKVLEVTKTEFLDFGMILKPDSQIGSPNSVADLAYSAHSSTAPMALPRSGFFEEDVQESTGKWQIIPLPEGQFNGDYAFRISDNTMLPVYRENDIVIVSKQIQTKAGDRVVVKLPTGKFIVSILLDIDQDNILLTTFNADKAEQRLNRNSIEWMMKITWASQ